MKKIINSAFALAIALLSFTSCEDVPMPYGLDYKENNGETTTEATGDGTEANPYNVAKALEVVKAGTQPTTDVYIKGIITNIKEIDTGNFGNATYYISDTKDGKTTFYIYRSKSFNNSKFVTGKEISVGDTVVVKGVIINYNGTPETDGNKSYLISVNGKTGGESGGDTPSTPTAEPTGEGTEASPYNVTAALKKGKAKEVFVKGYIVGYIYGKSAKDGTVFNADTCSVQTNILIAAKADETNLANCLTIQLPSGAIRSAINLKDHKDNYKKEVLLYGELTPYFGQTGLKNITYGKLGTTELGTKPEATTASEAKGTGTLQDPYNAAAAANAASKLADKEKTADNVYIKGIISQIKFVFSAQYGTATFSISEDGKTANEFLIYSTLFLGNKSWIEGNTQIKVGDEVIICGKLTNYKGTLETASKENYIYSLNGKTE